MYPKYTILESWLIIGDGQVLGGIADTVAQSLTAIRLKSIRNLPGPGRDISDGIEMPDYDEKSLTETLTVLTPFKNSPPPFDFERLTRFMAYGFIMSPLQFHWFAFLSRSFPFTKQSATIPALQRVCCDQLMFAPFGKALPWLESHTGADVSTGLACFFTFMTVTEGGGRRAVARKFQDVYLPALKANFMLWPAVQMLNFRVIPLQFQIVSLIQDTLQYALGTDDHLSLLYQRSVSLGRLTCR